MPLEIRPAVPAEFPAVADLCVAAYAPFLEDDHHYVATLRDVARRATAAELLVAADADSGDVLGTVTFVPDGGPLGEIAGPRESEFRMLAVDPAAQARGVGTALPGTSSTTAGAAPSRRRLLQPAADARRAPIYRRLGFRRVPERDWSPVPGIHLITFTATI